jgi:hypothetical protein
MKLRDAGSDLLDYANALMAENPSVGHCRNISLQNMKIGPADRRSRDPHDGIARFPNDRTGLVFPRTIARTVIDERFYKSAAWGYSTRGCRFEFSGCHLYFREK